MPKSRNIVSLWSQTDKKEPRFGCFLDDRLEAAGSRHLRRRLCCHLRRRLCCHPRRRLWCHLLLNNSSTKGNKLDVAICIWIILEEDILSSFGMLCDQFKWPFKNSFRMPSDLLKQTFKTTLRFDLLKCPLTCWNALKNNFGMSSDLFKWLFNNNFGMSSDVQMTVKCIFWKDLWPSTSDLWPLTPDSLLVLLRKSINVLWPVRMTASWAALDFQSTVFFRFLGRCQRCCGD